MAKIQAAGIVSLLVTAGYSSVTRADETAAASAPASAPAAAPASAPVSASAPPGFRYPGYRVEPEPRFDENGPRRWYGWQSLIGIIPSHLMVVASLVNNFNNSGALGYLGIAGHVATAPIVHWVHGNVGRGFLSLGLNVAVPYLGLLAAFSSNDQGNAIAVAVLGTIAWPILDVSLLHYDDPAPERKRNKEFSLIDMESIGVLPMLDRDKKGLSLFGRF